MKKIPRMPNLKDEEQSTLKWFIVMFYTISISFDLLYDFIIPKFFTHSSIDSKSILGYWIYIFLFGLIPFAYYLKKQQKQHLIKYIYFISYILLTFIKEVILYFGNPSDYGAGNAVDILWLLLSPIFVSRHFYWIVSVGLIIKYSLVGIIIQSPKVLFPILILLILSIFSLIILNRFQSYVRTMKNSYDQQLVGIVRGVIATLELKDPYTRGHSERVAGYALELAKEIGNLTEEELKSFNNSCLLHDIGKIHIPDHILMKPAILTKEEYEIIKLHPVVGATAISNIEDLKINIEVIRSHHERWDGMGYPDRLKGEEIPFLARVTSIADAFDAMTSSRSYRSALNVEEAYMRILEGSGTQFDPHLVNAFQKVYPVWKELHKNFVENTNTQLIDAISDVVN
jgi:HD-GYP domain-containing protein (c-di-GMP phosphodiesterase class II)